VKTNVDMIHNHLKYGKHWDERTKRAVTIRLTSNWVENIAMRTIRTVSLWVGLSLLSFPALATTSPCDLNQDGKVNAADVQLAVNMTLGLIPCTANIGGAGVCNVAIVQRVINAAMGQACNTSAGAVPHFVSLSWTASTSLNIAGYRVYRGSASGGPYTLVTSSLVAGTTFTDSTVAAGQTYYYVCTAVDTNNNESAYSNTASAKVPSP
jgi:hypothetical protein